jgi:hypothetical protein
LKGECVFLEFNCLETVGKGNVDQFVVFCLLSGNRQRKGKNGAALGIDLPAVRTLDFVLQFHHVIADWVLEVDIIVLVEVQVQLLKKLQDKLYREGFTGSHMVNSKLEN